MIVPDDDEIIIQMEQEAEFGTEKMIEEYEFDVNEEYENNYLSIQFDDLEEEVIKQEEEELEQEEEPIRAIIIQETNHYNIFEQDSSSSTQLNYEANEDVKVEVKIEEQDETQFVSDNLESVESMENLENQQNIDIEISESDLSIYEESDSNQDFSLNTWLIQPTGMNKFVLYDCFTKFSLKLDPQYQQDQQDYLNLLFFQYSEQYQEQL